MNYEDANSGLMMQEDIGLVCKADRRLSNRNRKETKDRIFVVYGWGLILEACQRKGYFLWII